jgi:hypothetical protein
VVDRRYRETRQASDRQEARSEAYGRALAARSRREARRARVMGDDGPAVLEAGSGIGGTGGIRESRSADPYAFAKVRALRGDEQRSRDAIFQAEGSGVYRPKTRLYERVGELEDLDRDE